MAWVRIDDQVPRHQKFLNAGPAAAWFWVCGVAHCQSQLTDGFISTAALPMIGVPRGYQKLADHLVHVGLWEAVEGGYTVHHYHDHNDTKAEAIARRDHIREQRRHAGFASGRSRRVEHPANGAVRPVLNDPVRPVLNPIPSHPIPSEKREIPRDGQWEDFKAKYPGSGRESGFMASQLFVQACEDVGFDALMAGLERYRASKKVREGFVIGMEKWLEKKLWIQEPEPEAPSADLSKVRAILERDAARKAAR